MIVTVQHARAVHSCVDGLRAFFERHPQLDMKEFVLRGLESEVLLALDDAMATAVVEYALKETKENGG